MDKAIILIDDQERCAYQFGESRIFYRRMSPARAEIIRDTHTKNGITNLDGVRKDGLTYCVLGWEGVRDVQGREVNFEIEKLAYMPAEIREDLLNRIIAGTKFDDLSDELKN